MNTKVSILIRYSEAGKQRTVPAAFERKTRRLKPGIGIVDGKERPCQGSYVIRWYEGENQKWQTVGPDANDAMIAQMKQEDRLAGVVVTEPEPVPQNASETLREAVSRYLTDVLTVRGHKAHKRTKRELEIFVRVCKKSYVDEITRQTLMDYQAWLRNKNASPKTRRDRLMMIQTFLGKKLLNPGDLPKVLKRKKSCYTCEEVDRMLAVANDDERFLIQLLIATGMREQEVAHTVWGDISGSTLTVTAKLDCRCSYCGPDGFKIKDCEERPIPLPGWFVTVIKDRKHTSDLLITNSQGGHEGHILHILQHIAFRAGINCGKCITRSGQSCAKAAVCKHVGTHKFRRSFATWNHVLYGKPLSLIQRWLGHSDIATTMIYICDTEIVPGINEPAEWKGFNPTGKRRLEVVA